jgi:hypothetical protein
MWGQPPRLSAERSWARGRMRRRLRLQHAQLVAQFVDQLLRNLARQSLPHLAPPSVMLRSAGRDNNGLAKKLVILRGKDCTL